MTTRPTLARRLNEWGLLLGVIGAAIGFLVGYWIGNLAIANSFGKDNSLGSDPGILLGYALSAVGFLAGMGFLNYPIGRLLGARRPSEEDNAYLHGEGGGLSRYFRMTTDHKVIGLQYLMMILAFLFIGGLGAMFIRSELLTPTPSVANAQSYLTLVGLHSTLMIFMASAAIIGPFGNYFVPIMIGSRNMAFPRLEALTFWLLPPAGLILLSTVFLGGFTTGWTGYAPLSDQNVLGMDAYLMAFALIGLSIGLSGLNMIATIITKRAPGMPFSRMPVFVWGVLVTSFLGLLASPALIAAVLMEMFSRTYQTTFFVPAGGGSPVPVGKPLLVLRPPRGLHLRHPGLWSGHGDAARVHTEAAVGLSRLNRRDGRRRSPELHCLAAPPVRQRLGPVAPPLLHVLDGADIRSDGHYLS